MATSKETVGMTSVTRRTTYLLLAILLLPWNFVFGWGDEGHMLVNRVAAQHVPDSMPAFFRQATERLVYLGPEPDRWRNKAEMAVKISQEPDHFIDLERLDGIGDLPPGRYEYIRKLYVKRAANGANGDLFLPEKVGLQPYITMEIYDRLKIAFREYRKLAAAKQPTGPVEQNIVYYAGWLGHYVADGANPLHTTVHYNGWVGDNPKGYTTSRDTHWNMEGLFVVRNLAKLDISGAVNAPIYLDNPFQDYVKYLWNSNSRVEKFYQLEKTNAFMEDGTPEGIEFIRNSLAAGTQMLLNLWYTAWVESEKPVQDPFAAPKVPAKVAGN